MKYIIATVAVILIIGGLLVYRGTSTPSNSSSTTLPADTIVYDVRTTDEYAAGHAKTAQLFPLQDIQAGKLPAIAKDSPIALYCRSGHRAGQALELLKQAGFTNVRSIGGLNDLSRYGFSADTK